MTGHAMRYEPGWGATVVCHEQSGADCRLQGADGCDCESWTIKRDPDGTPYHEVTDDWARDVIARHEMKPADYCNVVEFISEAGREDAFVGEPTELPITPVWDHDHYGWRFEVQP